MSQVQVIKDALKETFRDAELLEELTTRWCEDADFREAKETGEHPLTCAQHRLSQRLKSNEEREVRLRTELADANSGLRVERDDLYKALQTAQLDGQKWFRKYEEAKRGRPVWTLELAKEFARALVARKGGAHLEGDVFEVGQLIFDGGVPRADVVEVKIDPPRYDTDSRAVRFPPNRLGPASHRGMAQGWRCAVSDAKLTAEESCRQVLKSIADACDQESLARAGGYLFRYVEEETVLRDCGQRGVCRTPPGCARHWEERNRELLRENATLRSNSDHLSSENAGLASQVESMAMRIESLAEELAKPEDVKLREVVDALDGRAVIFDGLGARVGHLLDEMDEWIGRAGEAERLADERLAHANQLQADIEVEQQGLLAVRKRLGAREDETMGAFLERLATMAGVVPADVHERGWQWRPTARDTAFAPPFGTIRQCRVCGCLVAGGPTACVRCAKAGE